MPFTYDELVNRAKASKSEYINTEIPVVEIFYHDFAEQAGIDVDTYHSLQKYIKAVSYDDKKAVFESLGFKVLFMTLSIVKIGHFVGDTDAGPSIQAQFLANNRNVFIISVEVGMDSIYFLLEYPLNGDPLANYTVDREELKRKAEQAEKIRNLFNRSRQSTPNVFNQD